MGLGPFISAFTDSFYHDTYGERSFAGLENFRFILDDDAFPFSLNITVLWALLNVTLSLIFGFLLALRLVSTGTRKGLLYQFLLIPWGIPVYIAIPLWRAFLHGNGGESVLTRLTGLRFNLMLDPASGFIGALLVSLWLAIPLSAFVFAGHMQKISRQVIEAARIDGAGEGEIARYIYLPCIRESLLAMGILNFIKGFKEFTLVFMMTAGGPPLISGITDRHIVGATTTLGVFLYEIFLQTSDWGINAAYAIIMGGLVLFVTLIWILIKRKNALRPVLLLTALSLIPGGDTVLRSFAAVYVILVLFTGNREESSRRNLLSGWSSKILSLTVMIHLGYTLYNLAALGFLRGFHPGLLIAIFCLLLRTSEKGKNRELRKIPAYQWQGLRFRRFLPGRGYTTAARVTAGCFVILTVIILYMLLWMSLSRISACYMDTLLPPYPTVDNFRIIFAEEGILRYFGNTLILAGGDSSPPAPPDFSRSRPAQSLREKKDPAVPGVYSAPGYRGGNAHPHPAVQYLPESGAA